MLPDYFLRTALIVVLSMTMIGGSKAAEQPATITSWKAQYADGLSSASTGTYADVSTACVASIAGRNIVLGGASTKFCSLVPLDHRYFCSGVLSTSNCTDTQTNLSIATPNYTCPDGYTKSGTAPNQICTSNPAACPAAGTPFSSGVYDLGTQPRFPSGSLSSCANGCVLSFNGGVDKTAIVDGVTHYYATGEYYYDGRAYVDPPSSSCPAGTAAVASMAGVPSASCAPGQNYGTVNGKLVCLNSDGSVSGTDSAEALAAAAAAEADRIKSAAEKARQAAEAEATVAGKTAEEITVAGNTAAASAAGAAAANVEDDSPLGKFCADNPDAPICIETDYGDVDDVDLENKTIDVSITPVAVSGAGSCPAPSPLVIRGQTYAFEWTTYCNFANGIKPILLAFAWLAAAGIMVGGFRT